MTTGAPQQAPAQNANPLLGILQTAVKHNAADIHLKAHLPPKAVLDGKVKVLPGYESYILDPRILPQMLDKALAGDDIVVGTRYSGAGQVGDGLSKTREAGSRFATQLSHLVTGKSLSDPMSGFFLMKREVFDEVAGSLSNEGFKILLDIVVSASRVRKAQARELKIGEVPYTFRQRHAGESKMNPLVVVQFLGLVVSKMTGGILPTSFVLFGGVGAVGIVIHVLTLWICLSLLAFNFVTAQAVATVVSMTFNFVLNNQFTFADKKLKGWHIAAGLVGFYVICSIGANS